MVYSGPQYKSHKSEDGKIIIEFSFAGGGLTSRDGKPLSCFEIAGEDKKFVKADARIAGADKIELSASEVKDPLAARFAWSELAQPNLMNKEGLPAGAFRTGKPENGAN